MEESKVIAQGFIEEAASINDAADFAPVSNANASAASYAPSHVDATASHHDIENHAAYRGWHLEGLANEAVESDGPRELLAHGTAYSSSSAASSVLKAIHTVLLRVKPCFVLVRLLSNPL